IWICWELFFFKRRRSNVAFTGKSSKTPPKENALAKISQTNPLSGCLDKNCPNSSTAVLTAALSDPVISSLNKDVKFDALVGSRRKCLTRSRKSNLDGGKAVVGISISQEQIIKRNESVYNLTRFVNY